LPIIRHLSHLLKAGEQALGGKIRLELEEETNAGCGYPSPSDLGVESIADKFSSHVGGSPRASCTTGSCAVRTGLHERKEKKKREKEKKKPTQAQAGLADK